MKPMWVINRWGNFILVLMIAIFTLSSCSTTPTEEENFTITPVIGSETVEIQPSLTFTPEIPTVTATSTLQPSPTPEGLIYYNDFNGTFTGLEDWKKYELTSERHERNLINNYPIIENKDDKQTVDAQSLDPVYVIYDHKLPSSDIKFIEEFEFFGEGLENDGLVCRYSDNGWYELTIGNNGHWKIILAVKKDPSIQRTTLIEGDTTAMTSGVIKFGGSCIGNQFSVYLDNQLLGTIEDESLLEGDIFGFIHQEEKPFEMHTEISSVRIVDGEDNELVYLDHKGWAFYFSGPSWAVSTNQPNDIRSLMFDYSTVEIVDNKARLSSTVPSQIIMINPQIVPKDVVIDADFTILPGNSNVSVGVICNWSNENGGYNFWYRSPYTVIVPIEIDKNGYPSIMGGDYEFVDTRYEKFLVGETHHITAFCGLGMVKFYLDGNLISSHPVSEFKYPDANKKGQMVGFYFGTGATETGEAWLDNYSVSWGLPLPTTTP